MTGRRLTALLFTALALALGFAPTAYAYNNGRGFYGATNDKVVTATGFILIVFFPTFVFVMSMIQRHLERRKEARRAAENAYLSNIQWRGGW
jgi:phosphatidylglycerophosphate synthase